MNESAYMNGEFVLYYILCLCYYRKRMMECFAGRTALMISNIFQKIFMGLCRKERTYGEGSDNGGDYAEIICSGE